MYPSSEGLERLSRAMGSHLMAKINIPIDREIGAYKNKTKSAHLEVNSRDLPKVGLTSFRLQGRLLSRHKI